MSLPLPHPLLIKSSLFWLQLQQAVPAPATPADRSEVDVELLKQQIEFLKTANTGLADSFAKYVGALNTSLAIAGFALTGITLLGAVLFGKNLMDFRRTLAGVNQEVDRIVQQRVEQEVGLVVRNRIDRLEAVLAREAVLGRVTIDYVLPANAEQVRSSEFQVGLKVLEKRGFQVFPRFLPQLQQTDPAANLPDFASDIVVLDLCNAGTSSDEIDPILERTIAKVTKGRRAVVVYLAGRSQIMQRLVAEGHYCGAANGPLTLVARVLEAAYVVDALRG